MVEVGIGLRNNSVVVAQQIADAMRPYEFASYSVFGDVGLERDLSPYEVLHRVAGNLRPSNIANIGPMAVPVTFQDAEDIAMHAITLEAQLPGRSSVGIVPGALGVKTASLAQMEAAVRHIQSRTAYFIPNLPLVMGVRGPNMLALAGRLGVTGVKLGGTANLAVVNDARTKIDNSKVKLIIGATTVIDRKRSDAESVARRALGPYFAEVGQLDPTLDGDEQESISLFLQRSAARDAHAHTSISSSLLHKHAFVGTVDEIVEKIQAVDGIADRVELGPPYGLTVPAQDIKLIGEGILGEFV
jgi:hypothetical protein